MKTILTISLLILIASCRTWEFGETYTYTIPKGEHADTEFPTLIPGTEVWGGEITIEYDPDQMIDTTHNFSYWNKLGGMMPDLTSNWIEGKHQSARAAWRINPPEMDYIYLGYIAYVWGEKDPQRGYLLTPEGEKVKVKVGEPFYMFVSAKKAWWGITCGHEEAFAKIEDSKLKGEKFMVAMEPYYGGKPVAPTKITITITIKDTTIWY